MKRKKYIETLRERWNNSYDSGLIFIDAQREIACEENAHFLQLIGKLGNGF